ncbi:MAG: DUF2062 domain-containing protein [Candidatus Omnitrophica bacterium]|nr:DUF2062 domain-containing protein [Candidatus Omnitrophota bacterium]
MKLNRLSALRLLKFVYLKSRRIRDNPHRVALGFALGIFIGVMPAVGPLAAWFIASFLRINRISAILGSLISNTWVTFITFILSLKIGSWIFGLDWHSLYGEVKVLLKDFHFRYLLDSIIISKIMPLILGYIVISLIFAFIGYVIIFIIFSLHRKGSKLTK